MGNLPAMATFDAIADLPLEIEACEFEGLEVRSAATSNG